jgi:hypothetical protein
MTPEKTLRYLEHGYIMSPQEQDETAKYIRNLQQSNETLRQGLIEFGNQIFMLRRELVSLQKERREN